MPRYPTHKRIQKKKTPKKSKRIIPIPCDTCHKPLNLNNHRNFEPLTIPCGHKFHKRCLYRHLYHSGDPDSIRILSCPICQDKLYFPTCKHPIRPKPLASGPHPIWTSNNNSNNPNPNLPLNQKPENCKQCTEKWIPHREYLKNLEEEKAELERDEAYSKSFDAFKRYRRVCGELERGEGVEPRFWVRFGFQEEEELPELW